MAFLDDIKQFFRQNPLMWVVVALAGVAAILVTVFAFGGVNLGINKFFAAAPAADNPNDCFGYDANGNGDGNFSEKNDYQGSPNNTIPGIEDYHLLSYVGHYYNNCDYPVHLLFSSKGSTKAGTDGVSDSEYNVDTNPAYTRDPIDIPAHTTGKWKFTYDVDHFTCGRTAANAAWRFRDFPNSPADKGLFFVVFNYGKDCGATTTATPPPTNSAPVICAPSTQDVLVHQVASLTASGGDGTFHWDVTGGGVIESGGNENISITYSIPGTKTVRVSSGTASATCTVTVTSTTTPTPAPSSSAVLTVNKQGRDTTRGDVDTSEELAVSDGTVVQFVIVVTSTTDRPLTNIVLRDIVPPGMSYQNGSTFVEGQQVVIDTITTSGLPLGTLAPGDTFTARWSAIADRVGALPVGVTQTKPQAVITADGIQPVGDTVTLDITGTGTGAPALTPTPITGGGGGVQTGPEDAVIFAFLAAAALSLLYAAYTRSPAFRFKEVAKVSQDQGPLDFRS